MRFDKFRYHSVDIKFSMFSLVFHAFCIIFHFDIWLHFAVLGTDLCYSTQ